MRDPEGSITLSRDRVTRQLVDANSPAARFLRSPMATTLVHEGHLVPFEFTSAAIVESPRLPFISYPYEWCDAQLRAAGELTLEVSREVLSVNYELKDASAWNVLFNGTRPVFCDHLSFQPIARREWWAFGQFTRHFALPLGLSQHRGLRAHRVFSMYRDGVPAEDAKKLLGWRGMLSRLWPLMLTTKGANTSSANERAASEVLRPLHPRLYAFCESLLQAPQRRLREESHWSGYAQARQHYTDAAIQAKVECVDRWLLALEGVTAVDLGCNTGEFSAMAARAGMDVVSVDLDHDCIDNLFRLTTERGRIHPLVANLSDLSGGRGWGGSEFAGLVTRLKGHADVLMMLALLHHLLVSEGIPLQALVNLAAELTRRYAIVELIDAQDSMLQRLATQRSRNVDSLTIAVQLAAFGSRFELMERVDLPGTARTLVLLRLRDSAAGARMPVEGNSSRQRT